MLLVRNSPVWESFDRDSEDELDTDEMRKHYHEGFEWDCCRGAGNSMGCKQTKHQAAEDTNGVKSSVPKANGEAGGKPPRLLRLVMMSEVNSEVEIQGVTDSNYSGGWQHCSGFTTSDWT